jgi:PAS domain S-box-containing protein
VEGGATVVLVDDAPDVRALVRLRLGMTHKFAVVGEGGTGAEAVRLAEELQPQLLLLDVSMPDMDGIDALPHISRVAPGTKVVMFSGFEEHGLADRARALGAVDFIEKSVPIDLVVDRLVAVVADAPPPTVEGAGAQTDPVLQEQVERFRAAFDQAAIGMATLTLTGRVVRANASLDATTSAVAGEHVGVSFEDLVVPSDRRRVDAAFRVVASGGSDSEAIEHGLVDRRVVSTVAAVRDTSGTPLYLFLQVQDVTERRVAQEELRQSEERFRLLVESVADYAIFMLDPGGHVASWNIGAERAKGYAADEILGQHFSVFYPPDAVAAGHPQRELEIAADVGRYEEEGWRLRKDGSTFWANVVITALRDRGGELVGYAKVTRDVSERKRLLEDLARAAADQTQLLAVTAHELRTPVAVITGYASMLQTYGDDLDDTERREIVEALNRASDRLRGLVDDLFTAARLETGGIEIRSAPFDLVELAREVATDLGGDAEVRGEETVVLGDRGRVQQMISNYLTNALRYGAAPVRIGVSDVEGSARLEVTDAGPGIAADLEPRLFEKFAAGHGNNGSGLGLFIVRALARVQGGDAWHEPTPTGATFAMRLPLAEAVDPR